MRPFTWASRMAGRQRAEKIRRPFYLNTNPGSITQVTKKK